MKNIDISQVVDPLIQQPFTVLSLDFMQKANKEMFAVMAKNLIINNGYAPTGVPYLIEKTSLFDQAIYFNGEIYKTAVVSSSPTDYAHIDPTPDAIADPLLFTDNVSRNVHNDRVIIADGIATGALFNFGQVVDLVGTKLTALTLSGSWATLYVAPSYKVSNMQVFFQGNAHIPTSGGAGTIFTCKAPSVERRIPCLTNLDGTLSPNILKITTGGVATVIYAGSTVTDVYLDGLSYTL